MAAMSHSDTSRRGPSCTENAEAPWTTSRVLVLVCLKRADTKERSAVLSIGHRHCLFLMALL